MSQPPSRSPGPRFTRHMPEISGNAVNGLGEPAVRRASPFFWHPPDRQAFGALKKAVIDYQHQCPEVSAVFSPDADRGPRPRQHANDASRERDLDVGRNVQPGAGDRFTDAFVICPSQDTKDVPSEGLSRTRPRLARSLHWGLTSPLHTRATHGCHPPES